MLCSLGSFPQGGDMDKKKILLGARNIIDEVRAFVSSQADIWRRVPNLALEANGRSGYDGNLGNAYEKGVWLVGVPMPVFGNQNVYVDLANGNLIEPMEFAHRGTIADAHD